MRNSLSRRIALRRPREKDIAELEARLKELRMTGWRSREKFLPFARSLIGKPSARALFPSSIQWTSDSGDIESEPKPVAQAVMFCLMDVSGSMDEHLKDLAKALL